MRLLRRRNFLINRNLQLRVIAAALGYITFYIIMLAAAIFIPVFRQMRSVDPESNQAYMHAVNFLYLHHHLWPAVLIILAAVSMHALFFSHKIAGPMYRFRQIFLALKDGKIPMRQRLRKRDYLQAEMKLINEMLESLRIKAVLLQETQKAIADSIDGIAKRSHTLSDEKLHSLVRDLEIQGNRLAEHVLLVEKNP